MECMERFQMYKDSDFDLVITKIRNGTIKAGKYSHLVKIDKHKKMNGKEFYSHGN